MTPTEAVQGHTTEMKDDITEVVHDSHTHPLTPIILTVTLHIAYHLDIEAHQLTPEIAADHTLDQHKKPTRKSSHQSSSHSQTLQAKIHTIRNLRVPKDDPQMDYYSLDDHSHDSEEDSDHLN